MKEAYIVTVECRTRVVVNTTEGMTQEEIDNIALELAIKKLRSDPQGYIDGDNCVEIIPDEECPAGTFKGD